MQFFVVALLAGEDVFPDFFDKYFLEQGVLNVLVDDAVDIFSGLQAKDIMAGGAEIESFDADFFVEELQDLFEQDLDRPVPADIAEDDFLFIEQVVTAHFLKQLRINFSEGFVVLSAQAADEHFHKLLCRHVVEGEIAQTQLRLADAHAFQEIGQRSLAFAVEKEVDDGL